MTTQGNVMAATAPPKPGVFSSYGNGWKQLWPHFLILFVIGIIYFVLGMISNIPSWTINGFPGTATPSMSGSAAALGFISFLYSVFFLGPVSYGQAFAYLKASRNEPVEVQNMFEGLKNYWSAVGSYVLVTIIVIIGIILLIVPGIIFGCKLAFVPYLVADRKMGVGKALDTSWKMTKGHAGKVFLIGLLGIPIGIAGFICLGVGVIISIMWINMALASLYYAVSKEKEAQIAPNTPPLTTPVQGTQPQGPVVG